MRKIIPVSAGIVLFFLMSVNAFAHCEIPCGIYDDQMRIDMIREHIATIEKSMNEIRHLAEDNDNPNQLTRWVLNKENHATELQQIVSQYFLTQRIKLDTENYNEKMSVLHHMLIFAMKCKQTTDLDNVEKLRKIVDRFETLYFGKQESKD